MSASAMKRRCFWPPESVMNQAWRLSASPSWSSRRSPSDGLRIERGPQIHRLANLDALLELRLLQLHTDPLLKRVRDRGRDRARAPRWCLCSACANPSMHSIVVVLPAPFGPIKPKDLATFDLERDLVYGDGLAVGFAEGRDGDGGHRVRPSEEGRTILTDVPTGGEW